MNRKFPLILHNFIYKFILRRQNKLNRYKQECITSALKAAITTVSPE